jgi:hypothetical protein
MNEEFFWPVLGAAFVVAWGLIILLAQRMRLRAHLKLREMLHREMVLAMEKNVPLPEVTSLAELGGTAEALWPRIRRLLPAFSLGTGLALSGLGLGMAAAFYLAPDKGLNAVWSLGLIPLLTGAGFLLYHVLAGRAAA